MSKEYKLKLPCMKCGMVERHLNTPHWKCPNLKKDEQKKNDMNNNKEQLKTYNIKKTIIEKKISLVLNDGLGEVAYFTLDEAIKMCQLLNVNSDNNCRYEICQKFNPDNT